MDGYDKEFLILNKIYSIARDTAPVKLSIGYVRENQCRKGIVIHEAPPRIIEELVASGYMCDVRTDGVHVL